MTSFSSFVGIPAPPPAPRHPSGGMSWTKEEEKEAYPPAGFSSQDFPYRDNYPCKSVPVRKFLQVLGLQTFSLYCGRSPLPDRR